MRRFGFVLLLATTMATPAQAQSPLLDTPCSAFAQMPPDRDWRALIIQKWCADHPDRSFREALRGAVPALAKQQVLNELGPKNMDTDRARAGEVYWEHLFGLIAEMQIDQLEHRSSSN